MGKRMARWNMFLAASALYLAGTIAYGYQQGVLWGFPTPKHLMTNDKPVEWNTEADAVEKAKQRWRESREE